VGKVDVSDVPAWLTSCQFPLALILAGANQEGKKKTTQSQFHWQFI
jgi:hypothetical protein